MKAISLTPPLLLLAYSCLVLSDYEPNWDSLDARPLPSWYDEVKFGVFISWGLYAVPGIGNEWFWYNWKTRKVAEVVQYMEKYYPPNFQYEDFAPMLKADLFDPDEWADIIEASGAKYVTLITKHHSGWTNWPSATSWNWNSVDVGPHIDIVGAVAKAIKSRPDLHFGIYFSQFEWYHPLFLEDKNNSFRTQNYVKEVSLPQMYELVNNYEPEVIYSDGAWDAADTYWNSTEFLAWLYNKSPVKDTIVVNDRWGNNTGCKHGGYLDCSDRYHPSVLQTRKYESGATIDKRSWGYRRDTNFTTDFLTIENMIWQLVSTVSCGGNFLVNIGIPPDGRIIPIFEERLRQMGSWLNISGEAIYKTKPWNYQNDTVNNNVWYTYRPDTKVVYGTLTQYQASVAVGAVKTNSSSKISLVGYSGDVEWKAGANDTIEITMPPLPLDTPMKWAWAFKFENVSPK